MDYGRISDYVKVSPNGKYNVSANSYSTKDKKYTGIRVWSVADGQLVRQINLGLKSAGNYQGSDRSIYWDGRNASGEQVSSGIYFYRLEAGDYSQICKMVILK